MATPLCPSLLRVMGAYISQPAMKLSHALGAEAAGPAAGGVTRASFVLGALREISVGLCRAYRGNFFM
jgi:hypothetical protein